MMSPPNLGSLSNHDGNGNDTAKKQLVYISKTTLLPVHRAYFYISLPSLHDYDEAFFFFPWNSIQCFRIQLQKNLPTFDKMNETE